MPLGRVIYNLGCGHSVLGMAFFVSGELYCPWHQEKSPISTVAVWEWRAKCYTCRYARWAGLDKQTADIFVTAHLRRNTGHRPVAEYVTNPDAQKTQAKIDQWKVRVRSE